MLPKTPSQQWAQKHGACFGGRRRLGTLSIGEYWKRTPNTGNRAYDLLWILAHLVQPSPIAEYPDWIKDFYDSERRPTVKEIRQAAIAHGVTIPIELL